MGALNAQWKVQPHGPLERIDDRLLGVEGEIVMPLGRFPRRMTVAGLAGGGTAIWSAVPLAEPQMREIEALGPPEVLIVPGVAHRLDARPWLDRYPQMRVLCPPGATAKVAEAVPVSGGPEALADPEVTMAAVPGVGGLEGVLLVRRAGRLTLVMNDILANVRHPHGIGANIMARLLGFGVHRPRMPRVGKRMFVKDAAALAAALRGWADNPALARIVVSHGDVIADDPAGALRRAAQDLV